MRAALKRTSAEHRRILEALAAGDASAAGERISAHIESRWVERMVRVRPLRYGADMSAERATDQAIAKIKELISSGKFTRGLTPADGARADAEVRRLAELSARGDASARAHWCPRVACRRRHVRDHARAGAAADRARLRKRSRVRRLAHRDAPGPPPTRARGDASCYAAARGSRISNGWRSAFPGWRTLTTSRRSSRRTPRSTG